MWWLDKNDNDAYKISKLNDFYTESYFSKPHDHTSTEEIKDTIIQLPTGIKTILEAGSAGGWFTKKLLEQYDVISIEGSKYGIIDMIKNDIPYQNIIHHDLRYPLQLNKKFDIVICTEVAEHLEIPFTSTLIKTLTDHSNLVYFTFCEPREKHVHHPTEQYLEFWQSLFQFYNFSLDKQASGQYHRSQGYFFKKDSNELQ